MSLTTPLLKEEDSIFPGESWFFYWKTSPALWEEKVKSCVSRYLICPIFWGQHVTPEGHYDFGESVPECGLKKLVDIAKAYGKEVIFFLPLGPAPFLPNGGVPFLFRGTFLLIVSCQHFLLLILMAT